MPFRYALESFRDPDAHVVIEEGRVRRFIKAQAAPWFESLLQHPLICQAERNGTLIPATVVESSGGMLVLDHELIEFASFPHEWPPALFAAAGNLTLDLASEFLTRGIGLKDASAYNVLFRSGRPVFIDWTSFEPRREDDPVWLPAAQFIQTFILPLLVWSATGHPPGEFFLTSRDGLPPQVAARMIPRHRRLTGPSFRHITLPSMLSPFARPGHYQPRAAGTPEKARFLLDHLFRTLRRDLALAAGAGGARSAWKDYMGCDHASSYSSDAFREKSEFVGRIFTEHAVRTVLDIGCNTGYFSSLAARSGAGQVVSIDSDLPALEALASEAAKALLPILPLHISISRPTPSIGWMNAEYPSFIERMAGRFDLVLMLAVVHHLAVTERVPIGRVFELGALLTRNLLLIEFVSRDDPMFQTLLRGRDRFHQDWSPGNFEIAAAPFFTMLAKQPLSDGRRCLYLMAKR